MIIFYKGIIKVSFPLILVGVSSRECPWSSNSMDDGIMVTEFTTVKNKRAGQPSRGVTSRQWVQCTCPPSHL